MPNCHQPTRPLWHVPSPHSSFTEVLQVMTVRDHGNEEGQRAPGLQESTIQWGDRLNIFTQIIINYSCDREKREA